MRAMEIAKVRDISPTKNVHLQNWVSEIARLTKPDRVVWCDGSDSENHRLTEEALSAGGLIGLNQQKLPGCYLHRSHPNDVARGGHLGLISKRRQEGAGPTNNRNDPRKTASKLG